MTDPTALLTALQHGDSFFPSGGFAASWGLETLFADVYVHDADTLLHFVQGQLRHRWARCDRPALIRAHRAQGRNQNDLEEIARIDAAVEALALVRELRAVSRRTGRALLRVHARLQTPHAAAYLDAVKAGQAWGHIPVVQGLVWRGVGLDEETATLLSGHIQCVAFVSVAIRLGFISHIQAQLIVQQTRQTVLTLLSGPLPELLTSFTPVADIAMMRHETQATRLFAN